MTIELRPVKKENYSESWTLGLVGKNFPSSVVHFKPHCAIVECNIGSRSLAREILDKEDAFKDFQARIQN
jgi:hypothetical protein